MAGWTVRELARQMDLKPQTISGWINAGLVSLEERRMGRPGYVVGLQGIMELLTVAKLREIGFDNKKIKRVVANLRTWSGEAHPLAALTLVVRGQDIAWRPTAEISHMEVSALQQPGQMLLVFPFGELHEGLVQQLSQSAEREAESEELVYR